MATMDSRSKPSKLYLSTGRGSKIQILEKTFHSNTHFHNLPDLSKPDTKISRCRSRYKMRRHFRRLIESSLLCHQNDDRPLQEYRFLVDIFMEAYLGLDFWRKFAIAPHIVPVIETIDINSVEDKESNFHALSAEEKLRLENVVSEFPSFENLGLGCTSLVEHHIDTGDAPPIKCKHYPLSPPRQVEVYKELDRLLEMGVIEESNSPWCFPIVNVRKPGKVRLCLDSRKLNAITKKDSYPLPHINGLLSRLKDTHFISGIDLKDAFFQIRLTESSKEKTAFAVPGRPLYHYRVMPFGLCNGPQAMSRLMDRTIPSRLRENVFVYLDDLLVCSATFDEHIELLRQVAKCLKNAGLTINVAKSKFCQNEIKYLGYRIGKGCLKVDPDKVSAIVDFPLPKSPRQVRRFIGMANWYRSFINNFASMAGPLTDCLSKRQGKFCLSSEAIESFEKLKLALSSAPVLAQPDFSREFVIQCDASRIGVGGVLFQVDNENNERPISFVSQKLNRAQRNYTVTELECLAAVVCVKRFRPYIEGSHFRIITDHSSLKWLMTQKDLSGRLARWSLKLQGFDFQMEHRKGTQNIVPDALSRFDIDSVEVAQDLQEIDLDSEEFDSPEYNELKNTVSGNRTQLPDVCVINDPLYKRVQFRQGMENEEASLWRLWLPSPLQEKAIRIGHGTSCHGGYFKTLARVRQNIIGPLARDVRRSATSINVIDFFKNYIFNTFGVPQYIHSDNAKQFVSKEMQDFFSLFGVAHIRTGLYSPQANASERANLLRSDYHTAIQCSPYYALFGQNMCVHGTSYPLLEKLGMLKDDTFVERSDKLSHIRERLEKNLERAHEKATKVYNTRAKSIDYRVGQEIFRRNHCLSNAANGINAKFLPKYLKCRIRKKVGNALYEVEDLRGNLIGRIHASDLKP
ncbi:Retrovirus-related Pol polyprotein from transposon 297 [Eumeta japonica]|uniref:RNA-directed DNA polymerase n=1 Tax=Eumeta variegata TaxID=151549 RepID=A0A4C1TPZ8_EUMVA|nr:Retrovirus-related Pol polyprotein from transposon 297 [Eumeta japonica]